MVTTLITGGAVSFALLGVFLVLRSRSKRFYAPRTYLGSIPERFVSVHQLPTPNPFNTYVQTENGHRLSRKASLIGCPPFGSYQTPKH